MKQALLLVAVLLSSCASFGGFLGASGSIGPIAVSADGKSTVKVTAEPVAGAPPACVKPISVEFRAPDWATSCRAEIPVPPSPEGVCR